MTPPKKQARPYETFGLWIALTLIGLVAALSVWEARQASQTARWVEHTHRVLETLSELRGAVAEAEDTKRGFALTGDASSLGRYAPGRMQALVASLRAQTADNPDQQRRLDRLAPQIAHRAAQLDAAIARRRTEGFDPRREALSVREGDAATVALAAEVAAMTAVEKALLARRQQATDRSVAYGHAVRLSGVLTSVLILLVAFTGLRREVARRVRSERAARRSEGELAITLRSLGDGVLATDAEGRVERMNPVAERLTGWSAAEAAGRPFTEVCRLLHEETRAPAVDPVARVLREGVVVGLANHTVLIARDGTEVPIADSAAPIRDDDGRLAGVVLVFRDASAEHEAAARVREAGRFLDSVLENIPDVILVKSAGDLRIERVNRAAEALLGRPRAEVLGQTLADLGPPDVAELSRAMDREALTQRDSLPAAEVMVETAEGPRWLRTRRVPILGDDSVPRHLLVVAEDITERRRLEEDLRALNASLERRVGERTAELLDANARLELEVAERQRTGEALARSEQQFLQSQKLEAVGRLAGGIAHDFNNLLSVILGYCELLADDPRVEASVGVDIMEIARAGRRASDLTRQLLAFSRQQVLAPAVVELNEVLAGVGPMLVRLLGEDVELRLVPRSGLGKVLVDPGQLEQVILNLVVNARDAMPQGGTLTLETDDVELDAAYAAEHPEATPGPHVMLAVTDTGTGMDAATRAQIFEPFFTTKEKGKGTGLGLSTVFGIVRQSGGTVWVYSEPGRGTTFKIYLPRTQEVLATSVAPPPDPSPRGSETVLLAEDDAPLRLLVRTALARLGYQVLEAESADEALLLCARFSGPIHLLLTDVVMPKVGGRELAERLAALRPETRVLFMSGYTDDTVVRHGVLAAGIAFLQKPVTPQSLARKVREVLDAPRDRTAGP
jgi:two-component system cell cycle sensor histidine kinase/response regulator CckA